MIVAALPISTHHRHFILYNPCISLSMYPILGKGTLPDLPATSLPRLGRHYEMSGRDRYEITSRRSTKHSRCRVKPVAAPRALS